MLPQPDLYVSLLNYCFTFLLLIVHYNNELKYTIAIEYYGNDLLLISSCALFYLSSS